MREELGILRRFANPLFIGEMKGVRATAKPETVLLSMRERLDGGRHHDVVVAYPAENAKAMGLHQPFLMVCLPVNIRKNPEHRSAIAALPLGKLAEPSAMVH